MRIQLLCGSNFFARAQSPQEGVRSPKVILILLFFLKKLILVSGVQILHMHPNCFSNCLKSRIISFERDTVLQTKNLDSIKLLRASNFFCTWSKSLGRCSTSKSHPYFFLFEKKAIIFVFMLQNPYFRTR